MKIAQQIDLCMRDYHSIKQILSAEQRSLNTSVKNKK